MSKPITLNLEFNSIYTLQGEFDSIKSLQSYINTKIWYIEAQIKEGKTNIDVFLTFVKTTVDLETAKWMRDKMLEVLK